jgi:hypothetical protein
MLRIRLRTPLMMLCVIAGAIGYQSSAWAQAAPAIAQLQYPFYLNPVFVVSSSGSNGAIDFAASTNGSTFGGLVVLAADPTTNGNTAGFGYAGPSTGGAASGGANAVRSAIIDGIATPGTGFYSDLVNSGTPANGAIGYYVNGGTAGGAYQNVWRGINMSATGPTGGQPTILVSPTYLGDASLSGFVTAADYSDWQTGYFDDTPRFGGTPGSVIGWQNGEFNYSGNVTAADYSDWQENYLATNRGTLQFPGFGTPNNGPVLPAAGSVSAVPEPATFTLLIVPALAMVFFGYRRRKTS